MGGDREAFAELYREYAKTIYFHTSSYVWNKDEAEDVAQDVVVHMMKNIGQLQSPYAFTAWMHQVIRTVSYNYNDRFARKRGKDDALDVAEEIVDVSRQSNPADVVEAKDANALLYSQIEKLPKAQRASLVMYYYDEMKHREIAKVLGVKESTVSTNILKAKQRLREILENDRNFGGAGQLLGSAAMGPAIKDSLASAADNMMPSAKLEHFCDACAIKLQACVQGAAAVKAIAIGSVKFKFLVVVISAVALTGSSFFVYETVSSKHVVRGHEAVQFVPDAEIVFRIGEGNSNVVNPLEAVLVVEDGGGGGDSDGGGGKPSGWSIVDSGGTVVASGDGETVTDGLLGLSPGEYSIRWSIVKGNAEAFVKRTFWVK